MATKTEPSRLALGHDRIRFDARCERVARGLVMSLASLRRRGSDSASQDSVAGPRRELRHLSRGEDAPDDEGDKDELLGGARVRATNSCDEGNCQEGEHHDQHDSRDADQCDH